MAARSYAVLGWSMSRILLSSRKPCSISDLGSLNSCAMHTHSFPRIGSRSLLACHENPKSTLWNFLSPRALATSTSEVVSVVKEDEEQNSSVPQLDGHQQTEGSNVTEDVTKDGGGDEGYEHVNEKTGEIGGPKGPEPTRYGDWEKNGRCSDF